MIWEFELGSDIAGDTSRQLAWHRPQIRRLLVTLDTGLQSGSAVDCDTHAAGVDTNLCEL